MCRQRTARRDLTEHVRKLTIASDSECEASSQCQVRLLLN
jgi:hypothetical protein